MKRTLIAILLLTSLWPAAAVAAQEQPSDLRVQQHLVYARRGNTRLAMDVYLPPGDRVRPAVIWLHGGRWAFGDKAERGDVEIAATVAEHGFAVFSANYRLWNPTTGKPSYPAALEDVQDAVTWVRDNAERFGVDPSRIALAGNSSGAHLAALAATVTEGPLDAGSRVAAVVSFSGPMDLSPLLNHPNPVLVEAVEGFLGCSGARCEDLAREASPVTYVDGDDPPMLLFNANEELIPEAQAQGMAERLRAAAVQTSLLIPSATQHGTGYWSDEKQYKFEGFTQTLPEIFLGFLGDRLGVDVRVRGTTETLPSVDAPSPSPKVAPGGGKAGEGSAPDDERPAARADNDELIWVTGASVTIAVISLAIALMLLRRLRAPARGAGGGRGHRGGSRPLEPTSRR